jgi:hypothetical protein
MNTKLLLNAFIAALLMTLLDSMLEFNPDREFRFIPLGWNMFSNFLIAIIASLYIVHSTLDGYRLMVATFIILFIIGCFNILIEAFVFNVTNAAQTLRQLLTGGLHFLIPAIFLVFMCTRQGVKNKPVVFESRGVLAWLGLGVLSILLYSVFYMVAGMTLYFTYPQLAAFYAGKIPPLGQIAIVQLLRGFIFTGIALLVLQTSVPLKFRNAIVLGLIFSIAGGVAPLIPPNDYMPYHIRVAHGFEVGISNFLYGACIALLLFRKEWHTVHRNA